MHAHVTAVEIVDPLTVRFHLKAPWPDFMTFYGTTATAAGIVVPKRYLEQVGEDGFKQHPIGLGPYKFVRHTPGVDVVLEAYEGYWRKVPPITRLIMKGGPEGTTRLAMLKQGEADIAIGVEGPLAEEVKRDPRLTLVDAQGPGMMWIEFTDQWDPKSVWADPRLRLAVNYVLDRQAINEAACLGYCPPAGVIVPRLMDYALPREPLPYDPQKAKQLLAEAGYPTGFDAGELVPVPPFFVVAEAVVNDLNAVGIRVKMRTMERAAFYTAWREKKLRGLVLVAAGASGNAATRVETFIYTYCLPLSRFRSYLVISIASDEYLLATRPWPGGAKRIGGRTSYRTDFEAIGAFLLPCTATGVSLLALWRRIGATPRGQPWTPAVTLPHDATG